MAQEQDAQNTFEIPSIQPFQFDPGGNGEVSNSVNLFRGDLNLPLNLVSLPGRNGLNVGVSIMYRSDVKGSINTWNRDAPTGVVGLGWYLPLDSIVADVKGSGTRDDNDYFYVQDESTNQLRRSPNRWQRGVLDGSFVAALNAGGQVSDALRQAFGTQSLRLSAEAQVTVVTAGQTWVVDDPTHEVVYALEFAAGLLTIYDGGLAYELISFQPWRIRYYPAYERWEITRSDGVTSVYGGGLGTLSDGSATSLGDSIQWGVRWDNWIGPSMLTHDPAAPSQRIQQQYALTWSHSKSYTVWDDETLYTYMQTRQLVGADGLPYTKACYLSQITDVFGRTVVLNYEDKIFDPSTGTAPREYLDPYKATPDNTPNAYQSTYETKYLQQIDVKAAADGVLLYSFVLTSAPANYATLPSGLPPNLAGDTAKRTLYSISKVVPGAPPSPPTRFKYFGTGETNAGALKTITYPKGATTTLTYQQKQLPLCARSSDPIIGDGTPRVWFGPDYAVVTWYDGAGRLSISVYTWIGRWQRWLPPQPTVSAFVDLDSFDVLAEDDFFVLYYASASGNGSQFWAFHKDANFLGQWLPFDSNPLNLSTTRVQVAGGDDFFAIADRNALQVSRYTWDALGRQWTLDTLNAASGLCTSATAGQSTLFIAGSNNYLVTLCYDKVRAPGTKQSLVNLYYLDEAGVWSLGSSLPVPKIVIDGDPVENFFSWSTAPSFAAATYVTNDTGISYEYAVAVFSWGADGDAAYRLNAPQTFPFEVMLSQPSGTLTIPFLAQVLAGDLIASGPNLLRFNGSRWLSNNNLQPTLPVTDDNVFAFSYGVDVAIKTENSAALILAEAQAFNPNTESTSWRSSAISIFNGSPILPRQTHYSPTAAPDFLTWDTNVYGRGTSTNWVRPFQTPLPTSLPDNIDTTTVVNQGPDFLAYLVESPGSRPVPQETQVLIIQNGQITGTETINQNFFRLAKQGGGFQSNIVGKSPAGPASFVTFLPLTADFDNAQQLTLHRFLDNSIENPISDYPVSTITIADGYETTTTLYSFDETTAYFDASGTVAKYYLATVFPGAANTAVPVLGSIEHYFVNGMPRQGASSGTTVYPSVVDGSPSKTIGYDPQGRAVLETDLKWQVFSTVQDLDTGATRPLFGSFARLEQMTTTKDGVSRTVNYTYDPATGQPSANQTTIANADGLPETHASATLYGFAAYDLLRYLNILAPAVQSTTSVQVQGSASVVTSVGATPWAPFPRAVDAGQQLSAPAAHKSYRWLGGTGSSDFQFDTWSGGSEPPAAEWYRTSLISARSARGLVAERLDPDGQTRSTAFDAAERFPVASFVNASLSGQEAYFYGFQDYESPLGWALDLKTTPIIVGDAFTGTRSLQLPPGTQAAPLTLTPARQAGRFLFYCWAKTPAGYDPASPAGCLITFERGGVEVGDTLDVSFGATQSEWSYFYQQVDLTQLGSDGGGTVDVVITFYNKGTAAVLIDTVTFADFAGQFAANVYDEDRYLITAEVGPYRALARWVYDSQLRLMARTGSADNIQTVSTSFLSRQTAADSFDPAQPNLSVSLRPAGSTFYDRFRNGGDWAANWSSTQPADWTSDNGTLSHTTSSPGSISLNAPAVTSNFFASIELAPQGALSAPAGVTIGAALNVTWDPGSKLWSLKDQTNGTTLNSGPTAAPGGMWTLVFTDAALLFLVDGQVIFSYLPAKPIQGAFGLTTSDPIGFTNFLFGESPEVNATFDDGSGKTRQRHAIDGASYHVSATLYDALAQAVVSTKVASYDADQTNPLLTYRGTFASIDWSTGVMSGDIAASYPDDQGYPYSRRMYEPTPLGRLTEIGAPGKDFAIVGAGNSPHTVKYQYGSNAAGQFPQSLNLPANSYFLTTATDQDGIVSLIVVDALTRPVASGTVSGERIVTASQRVQYTPTGTVSQHFLPNYYNPPDPAQKQNWVVTRNFDMLRRLQSITSPQAPAPPGSATSSYIYNSRGNIRFSQDAQSEAAGLILYVRYDPLGRRLDQGVVPGIWNPATLQEMADSAPEWPGAPDGAIVARQFTYDGDGTDPNQFGRLTGTRVTSLNNPASPAYLARFVYDDLGRVAQESAQCPAFDAQASYAFAYAYDNLSRTVSATYPSGLTFKSQRDALGQVTQIEGQFTQIKGSSGTIFASYAYEPSGRISNETLSPGTGGQLTRTYAYNSPGWLDSISDDLFTETLSYTQGGFGGAGYYGGKIASVQCQLTQPAPGPFPTKVGYAYAYDALGRLATAQCTADGSEAAQWSLGASSPVTYDDNGNIATLPLGADTSKYEYQPGTDFAINTGGGTRTDYAPGPGGTVVSAAPRGIANINYDAATKRASSLELKQGATTTFEYDSRGRRVLKASDPLKRLYLRGRSSKPVEEREFHSGAKQPNKSFVYLYGPTGLLGVLDGEVFSAYVRDHLGSVRAVADTSKNVLAAYHYLPFGAFMGQPYGAADAARYLFTGQEFESETGLYNMTARFYDPNLGRFYATDPARQFPSPYVYAGNNPVSMLDPNGEFSFAAFFVGALLAIVGVAAIIVTAGADAPLVAPAVTALEGTVAASTVTGTITATGAIVGGAALGAGTSGIQYAATHNRIDGSEFGEALGAGALAGAVSGAAGFGLTTLVTSPILDSSIASISSPLLRAGINALRAGVESAVTALPGQAAANAATHQQAGAGMLDTFLIGFGTGAFIGALTAPKPEAVADAGPQAHDNGGGNDPHDQGGHDAQPDQHADQQAPNNNHQVADNQHAPEQADVGHDAEAPVIQPRTAWGRRWAAQMDDNFNKIMEAKAIITRIQNEHPEFFAPGRSIQTIEDAIFNEPPSVYSSNSHPVVPFNQNS